MTQARNILMLFQKRMTTLCNHNYTLSMQNKMQINVDLCWEFSPKDRMGRNNNFSEYPPARSYITNNQLQSKRHRPPTNGLLRKSACPRQTYSAPTDT